MSGAMEVGAAGLRAEQRALEILANNVANVNTPGFKRAEAFFAEVLAQSVDSQAPVQPLTTGDSTLPGGGVRVISRNSALTEGEMKPTGNPLDLAIDGQGFVELMGPDGQSLLWRGGRLRIGPDGLLGTSDGIPLRATINIPRDLTALSIAPDGVVTAGTADGEQVELGQIGLVRIEREDELEQLDGGVYRLARDARPIDALPGEDGAGRFAQGSVEQSNVGLTEEMVQMMMVQRAYGANAQAIQTADQLAAITNNLRK